MPHNNSNNTDSALQELPSSRHASGLDQHSLMPREQRVIVVCDVVESVRWMEHDEDNAITRWSQFAAAVRSRIAPEHAGSVVKSTGDGLMLEFESAPQAVAAANAMQKLSSEGNAGFEPERQMHLRVGIHQAQVRRDAHDLYGHGVNLAARISTLAGPGEIIVTPEVRDHLTDSLDGDIEDMGECYLKHLSEPQRVYRVSVGVKQELLQRDKSYENMADLRPIVAILPFQGITAGFDSFGDYLADGLIHKLATVSSLRVMSRLSTASLKQRTINCFGENNVLKAQYVVTGSFAIFGSKVTLNLELAHCQSSDVVWSERLTSELTAYFAEDSDELNRLAAGVIARIVEAELRHASESNIPNLTSYSLMLSGITLMHRHGRDDFEKSQKFFQHLIDRHPKAPQPKAWLAKWYVLRSVNAWHSNLQEDAKRALDLTQRAVDQSQANSLSLAMMGYVYTHMLGQPERGLECLQQAVEASPSEPMAWLFRAVIHATGLDPSQAVSDAHQAHRLSPLDPLQYFFQSIQASAYLSAHEPDSAIKSAQTSLRLNCMHLPTYRVLLTAQYEAGDMQSAIDTAHQLKKLAPNFSLAEYRRGANASSLARQQTIRALEALKIF
jgi:adenylate cyclase